MEFWMTPILWGIEPWRLAAAGAILFLGLVSRRLVVALFQGVLSRLARSSKGQWDDDLVELLPAPLSVGLQLFVWLLAKEMLLLPTEPVDIDRFVRQGLLMALMFTAGWALFRVIDVFARLLGRLSTKTDSRLDDQIVPLVRKSLKVLVGVTVFTSTVQNLGYSVTSLLASLGVGGLALALAAKDTVANLFGSVVVFTDRPFQIGDWVEFDGIEGTVEEVGFRTTRIRRFDKSLVTVPNQLFSTTPITNHSVRPVRRISTLVGIGYEASPDQLSALLTDLRKLLTEHEGIDQGFHFVHFTELGDFSLAIQIYCFTKSTVWVEYLAVQEDLLLQVMRLVEKNRLEIAFPTRTVYFRDEHRPSPPSSLAQA
ncbi:MAG: mechanosensitive ion channel family protein [Myxococcota bacterium]